MRLAAQQDFYVNRRGRMLTVLIWLCVGVSVVITQYIYDETGRVSTWMPTDAV